MRSDREGITRIETITQQEATEVFLGSMLALPLCFLELVRWSLLLCEFKRPGTQTINMEQTINHTETGPQRK